MLIPFSSVERVSKEPEMNSGFFVVSEVTPIERRPEVSGKGFCPGQADEVNPRTDHRLGFAGKTSSEFHAQLCVADRFPNHKSSRRADINNA